MKITDTIHALRHDFKLLLEEGRTIERFVYSYLIVGKTICLIDALVREIRAAEPGLACGEMSRKALVRLGIRVPKVLFMVEASFRGHWERIAGTGHP